MLQKLFLKFKKLDLLNSQRNQILLKTEYLRNHSLLKQVINDTFKLRDFLMENKISPEDTLKVEGVTTKKIFKVHDLNEIRALFEILHLIQFPDIKDLLKKFINKTNEDIQKLEISEKMLIFKDLKGLSSDKEILKYICNLQNQAVNLFIASVDLDPKKLDRWICNLRDIFCILEDSMLISEYKKHELIYLQVCLKLINQDNLMEDLIFLVNKIKRRSKAFKIDISEEIQEILYKNKMKLEPNEINK